MTMTAFHLLYIALLGVLVESVKVPGTVPGNAGHVVDHQFAGVAIESLSWPNYTKPFSQNMYNALAKRTGKDVIIRLGGTSM